MSKLPLFPLELVLLPYESLPLHIFEPRYKKMVKSSIEEDKPFGIILKQGKEVFYKGCRVKVTKVFKEYQNGEYDILLKGVKRFKIISKRKMRSLNPDHLLVLIWPFRKEVINQEINFIKNGVK